MTSGANKKNASGVQLKNNLKLGEWWHTTPYLLVTPFGMRGLAGIGLYICAHMMTVQHKQVLPRTDYHRYSRSFGVMAHKKREGICPWHKICRLRVSTVSKQAHQDKLIDVPPISPLHCLFDVQRRPVHIGNTAGHDLDTKYDSILVYIEISIDHDPYREQYRSLIWIASINRIKTWFLQETVRYSGLYRNYRLWFI